jgi:hypothetical protein
MGNIFKIFVQIRAQKTPFQEHRQEDDIENSFTDVGRDTVDWIYLAQNMIQCRAPEKRVSRNSWDNRATLTYHEERQFVVH